MLKELVPSKWNPILKDEFDKQYFLTLDELVSEEYKNYKIYPPKNDRE